MNKQQLKHLGDIANQIEAGAASFEHVLQDLIDIAEEEQERFNALSDKVKESERGQEQGALTDALHAVAESAQAAFDQCGDAVDQLRGIEGVPRE